jgi:hypothetical protein
MIRRKIYNTNKREKIIIKTIAEKERGKKNDEEKATAPMEEKKIRTKEEKKKGRGGKRKGENSFEISAKGEPVKRRKKQTPPQCLVWFRLNGSGSSQMAKTVSSTTGALVGAGSVSSAPNLVFPNLLQKIGQISYSQFTCSSHGT